MKWKVEGNPAENYERYLVPTIFVPLTDDLMARAEPRVGDHVLDVACGTGIIARKVAPLVVPDGQVSGIDISPAMLEVARSKSVAENVLIEWHEGDVVEMPFKEETFDLAFCQQALQFFTDRVAGLQEIHRILRSGARIAINVFGSIVESPGYQALTKVLENHMGEEAAASRRAIFSLADGADLKRLLSDAGFVKCQMSSIQLNVRFPSAAEFLRRQLSSWKVEELEALDEKRQAAMVDDFSEAMLEFVGNQGLRFPMRTHVLVANK